MVKVIGYFSTQFKTEDGTVISGINLIYGNEIKAERGEGIYPDKPLFFTQRKLEQLDYTPVIGENIEIVFNRQGKVQNIIRV